MNERLIVFCKKTEAAPLGLTIATTMRHLEELLLITNISIAVTSKTMVTGWKAPVGILVMFTAEFLRTCHYSDVVQALNRQAKF